MTTFKLSKPVTYMLNPIHHNIFWFTPGVSVVLTLTVSLNYEPCLMTVSVAL